MLKKINIPTARQVAESDLGRLRGAGPAEPDRLVEVHARTRKRAATYLGPSGVSAATSRVGVVQHPVRVRAQVDHEAAVDEPAYHERPHGRPLTDTVGPEVPRESAPWPKGGCENQSELAAPSLGVDSACPPQYGPYRACDLQEKGMESMNHSDIQRYLTLWRTSPFTIKGSRSPAR
ncbi:hypothetical protein [Streptomyces griseofuscus]|uniref:hypothetical protein n=1 Tax=Streptomyces griseofuscus TaxID=146922 RepID=UPI003456D64E